MKTRGSISQLRRNRRPGYILGEHAARCPLMNPRSRDWTPKSSS
jgi:hypothetical protein